MKYKIVLIVVSLLLVLTSCTDETSSPFEDKISVFCYAYADSTLTKLSLARYGKLNEPVSQYDLGISDAEIELFEDGNLIGRLEEYEEEEKKGVYHLPDSIDFVFTANRTYKIEVQAAGYDACFAETICPPAIENLRVYNYQTDELLTSIEEDPTFIDTVYYEWGVSPADNIMVSAYFDSTAIIEEERMVSFSLAPDNYEDTFWLEDTTDAVWEDYPLSVKFMKEKDNYGINLYDYSIRDVDITWSHFYHKGEHTLTFASTDTEHYQYRVGFQGAYDEEPYTNIIGGSGLFTISNPKGVKNRYRIFVVSNQD